MRRLNANILHNNMAKRSAVAVYKKDVVVQVGHVLFNSALSISRETHLPRRLDTKSTMFLPTLYRVICAVNLIVQNEWFFGHHRVKLLYVTCLHAHAHGKCEGNVYLESSQRIVANSCQGQQISRHLYRTFSN